VPEPRHRWMTWPDADNGDVEKQFLGCDQAKGFMTQSTQVALVAEFEIGQSTKSPALGRRA